MAHPTFPQPGADLAVASKAAKDPNQDACGVYRGRHYSAIALADGLGSSFDAHIAAQLAVDAFLTGVQEYDQLIPHLGTPALRQLWTRVARAVAAQYTAHRERYRGYPQALQTTLLTLVDLPDSYLLSYLGNGSILHVRGDVWRFWERRWPWCVTDLMLGHSYLSASGKDTLYGVVAPSGLSAAVRILQVWKDPAYGDILVLCSDGVSSSDHLRVGRDANNKLWSEVNPHVDALLTHGLKTYFAQCTAPGDSSAALTTTVQALLTAHTFDDDATLGLLVAPAARAYYRTKHQDAGA